MSDVDVVVASATAGGLGLLLGVFFYAGLGWTVHRAFRSHVPAAWFVCSLALRSGVALAGFYWIATHSFGTAATEGAPWQRLLTGMLCFLVARLLVVHLSRPAVALPFVALPAVSPDPAGG